MSWYEVTLAAAGMFAGVVLMCVNLVLNLIMLRRRAVAIINQSPED